MTKALAEAYSKINKNRRSISIDKENPEKMDECTYLDTESDYLLFSEFSEKLSQKYGYSSAVIKRVWYNMFEFMIEEINNIPNLDKITLEEFNKLKTGFNIKNIGKLDVEYKNIINMKNSDIVRNQMKIEGIKGNESSYKKVREELQKQGKLFDYNK